MTKIKKVIKHDNDLVYNSVHNFNKYSVSNFNEISSIDSKFDAINKFYKDLVKLKSQNKNVKSQNKNTKEKKITVLKNASLLYYELINMYKKDYEKVFENTDEDWREKHDYKHLKDFGYQADVTEKKDEDKTDQELPTWIKVTKIRFNEIKDVITRANESKLTTRLGKRNITLKDEEKLLEDVISGKIIKKKAKKMYNNIAEDANKLNKLNTTEPRKKCCLFLNSSKKFLEGLKQMKK